MNESGTNSVMPPVRSCNARMTRMCSASSQGSSMCPNITVAVERRPARCEASMISTQRATGSLLGEIRSRTPSCRTSAAVPGVEPRPASRNSANTSAARQPRDVAHVRDLHRRVGVQMQIRCALFGETQPMQIGVQCPVGVDAGLDAQLGGAELDGLVDPLRERPPRSARRHRVSACPDRTRRRRSRPCTRWTR